MILLPLLIPLALVLGFLVLLGLMQGYNYSLGPLLRGIETWLGNVTVNAWVFKTHPFKFLAKEVGKLDNVIRSAMGHQITAYDLKLAKAVTASATSASTLSAAVEFNSLKTLTALQTLTGATIPKATAIARAPALDALRGIDEVNSKAKAREKALASSFATGIDRVRARGDTKVKAETKRAKAAEAKIRTHENILTKDIAKLKSKFAAVALTGLVVAALTRFLGSWIKCPSLRRVGKRIGCGGFAFLEDLLALTFVPLIASDLCAITSAMTKAAQLYAPVLDYLAEQIPALLACQKASRPKALSVRWYEPPPVGASIEL